jgi:hypothetical protein
MLHTQYNVRYHWEPDAEVADDESEPASHRSLSGHLHLILLQVLVPRKTSTGRSNVFDTLLKAPTSKPPSPDAKIDQYLATRPRRLKTLFIGGMNVRRCTRIFRVWHWII